MNADRDKIAIEYKCIVPGQFKLPVGYTCPHYHVFQVLLEMFVTGAGLLWLCFYSKQSMTVIECDFDPVLCTDLLRQLAKVFDKQNIIQPSNVSDLRRDFKQRIDEYVEFNTRFVGEFPVVETTESSLHLCSAPFNPYHIVTTSRQKEYHDECEVLAAAQGLWQPTKQVVEEAVELLREEATELLGFVVTNSLRLHQENEVPYVPVAYALRGESVSCDIIREMWNRVLTACHRRNFSVSLIVQ